MDIPSTVYYTRFDAPIGSMWIASSEKGVCQLSLPNKPFEPFFAWLNKAFPKASILESSEANSRPIDELQEYLKGELQSFSSPLDMHGTAFQKAVWEAVARIPYGETRSYANIAEAVGRPTAFRAVGAANGANPLPLFVPCHRVIGHNGSLTGYGGGLSLKTWLLEMEQAHLARA